MEFAANGYIITGNHNAYRYLRKIEAKYSGTAGSERPVAKTSSLTYTALGYPAKNTKVWTTSGVKALHTGCLLSGFGGMMTSTANTGTGLLVLLSSPHTYYTNGILTINGDDDATDISSVASVDGAKYEL